MTGTELTTLSEQDLQKIAAEFALHKKKPNKSKKTKSKASKDSDEDSKLPADENQHDKSYQPDILKETSDEHLSAALDAQTPPTFSYSQLLNRLMDTIQQKNPSLIEKTRATVKPPIVSRLGTKRVLWMNFAETCSSFGREPDHVFEFMLSELGADGSMDDKGRMVIQGKVLPMHIESLLKKYSKKYVKCLNCHQMNTELVKDSVSRLHFVRCLDCKSSRSVTRITEGYHAKTRADRRAMRNTAP